jgi:hypothetical protein
MSLSSIKVGQICSLSTNLPEKKYIGSCGEIVTGMVKGAPSPSNIDG